MDVKFKIKGFALKVSDEIDAKVEEIEVEYKNFELKQIPAIIKETRKAMREFAEVQSSMNSPTAHFGLFDDANPEFEEEGDDELELEDDEDEDDEDEIIEEKAPSRTRRGAGKKGTKVVDEDSATLDE